MSDEDMAWVNDLLARSAVRRQQRRIRLLYALLALIGMVVIWAFAVSHNAFGRNIHGTVTCQSGFGVTGVFVQTERLPRFWNGGKEVQSGFANSWWRGPDPNSYVYDFWVPLGGRVSIHVGCGGTQRIWGSDNYSEFYGGSDELNISCDDPPPPIIVLTTLTTEGRCHRV